MSAKIAIVGSGQLAQMMAQAGIPMGMQFSFLAETTEDTCCVDTLGTVVVRDKSSDASSLYKALGEPDVVSVEKEHVDIDLLIALEQFCPVRPNPRALEKFKNRRVEKRFLQSLNIPISPFLPIASIEQIDQAASQLKHPVFLKSEEEGYDGYNQYKVTEQTLDAVKGAIQFPSEWVAESFVDFQREVSFLAARSVDGEILFYPAVENYHRDGTLLTSIAPAENISEAIRLKAESYLTSILEGLDYIGLICMECFLCDDELLVNEIAPRVHNSGHWTSKGALTSQFENHVRAVSGLSLGSTEVHGISGMLNLLGVTLTAQQVSGEKTFLTLYGKAVRPRRKLGHVTINHHDYETLQRQLRVLKSMAYKE